MHLTKECVALSDEVTLSRRAHGTGRRNPNSLQTRCSVSVLVVSRVSACMLSHALCDPMDCSPPGSSGHGISQARILVWVDISFSRGSFRARDHPWISYLSCVGRRVLYYWCHLGRPSNRVGVANQLPQPPQGSENALQDKIRFPNTSHITMCVCPKSLNDT